MRSEGYIVPSLFVCHSLTTLQASVVRHQRSVNDTLESFDSWILLTMLASRDMAKFVSQEAYGYDILIAYELFMRFSVVKNVAAL